MFGGEALASGNVSDREALRSSLAEMFKELDGELWAADVEQVARCMYNIPEEMLARISLHEFVEQYDQLRSWLGSFRKSSFGREILNLVRCKVTMEPASGGLEPASDRKRVTTDGAAGHWQRKAFWTDVATIVEATDHTFIPAVGIYVHVRRHGRCRVEKVETRVCNTRLYRWIMSTSYEEVRALKVWHVVRAYHRCTLLATPSESLAESVGSILADAACSSSGRAKDVSAVTQATIVRMAGLRGHGGEEGIMADAMNFHFGGKGPESWHVRRERRAELASGNVCVAVKRAAKHRRIRLAESQPWVSDTLLDTASSGQQTYCKVLPRPSKFIELASGSSGLASGSSHVSATGDKTTPSSHARRCEDRRRAVQGDKREANPSKLSDFSWDSINATANALSNDKKPGKYFR